jgi:hypothetical protein
MSDLVVFIFGFVLFAVTTSATMWFGYQQFNRVYRADMEGDPKAPVLMADDDNFEYRVPADQVGRVGFDPIGDDTIARAQHGTP